MKMSADPVSGESLLSGSEVAFFAICPHLKEGTREQSGVSFIRTPFPFTKAPTSWPKCLPNTPPPNTITLGSRPSIDEFCDYIHNRYWYVDFLWFFLVGFWYKANTSVINCVGKHFSLVPAFGRVCKGLLLVFLG